MYIKSPNAKILICDEKVILCNIRNGGFVKTSKAYFEYLEMYLDEHGGKINVEEQNNTVKKNTYKLFQELCKIYFYIPAEKWNEEKAYKYQVVYLSLTNRCNLKCKHCVASAGIEEIDHMNTEEWERAIDQVITLNPEEINLTGGEPLIRPDFCSILKYLREKYKGIITLATNALLLNDELLKIIRKDVDYVSVSLDGFDAYSCMKVRGKGIFDKVVAGIRSLKKAGVEKISVSMLETKYTYGHDEEFYSLCRELGVKPLIRRFAPVGRGEENQRELLPPLENLEKIEKRHLRCSLCQPGTKELNISENGDVYPCAPLSGNENLLMGNILQNTIEEIISNPVWKERLEELRPWRMERCRDCNVNLFCHSCINYILGMQSDEEIFQMFCKRQKQHLSKIVWGIDYEKQEKNF